MVAMTWDKGIEAAAKAAWPIVLAQHEMIDPAPEIARAAIHAFLDAQPTVQWCETHGHKARPACWNSVGTPYEGHGRICSIVPVRLVKEEPHE